MAGTQQVRPKYPPNEEEDEERPEAETSRSRSLKFKASNMSFGEMLEMVDILKRSDYDGKYGPYLNPNVRKAKIMSKVVRRLYNHFGVQRSKEQLRKRWSDLKLREADQYRKIKRILQKRERKLGPSEETPKPTPTKKGERAEAEEEEEEEGEIIELGEIVTTTGDVDVVEEKSHFTTESAHVLIGEIMVCNRDLDYIKQNINDVQQKLKNIIDILGKI